MKRLKLSGRRAAEAPGIRDGVYDLAASMIIQAIRDLRSADPIRALDAFLWLVYDDAALWLGVLGVRNVDEDSMLGLIGEGKLHAKRRRSQAD